MVDFHSHILPGVDDGSDSPEQSVAMLRAEAAQGIRHVIATPHFYPHRESVESFIKRREAARTALEQAMAQQKGMPELRIGAEVFYYTGISDSPDLRKLAIEDTNCVLVEMPDGKWTPRMYRELEKIALQQGLTPIVAHIDRYIRPWRTGGIPQRLAELPVVVQANGTFFLDRKTRSLALRLLKNGQIHLLGSDAHNMEQRPPNLGAATELICNKLGETALKEIMQTGRKLLENK